MRACRGGLAVVVLVCCWGCREAPGRVIPEDEAIVAGFDAGESACIARLNDDRQRIAKAMNLSDGFTFSCALLAALGALVTALTKKESPRQRMIAATLSFVSAAVASSTKLLDDPAQLTATRARAAMHYEAARRVGKQLLVVSTVLAKDKAALHPERAHELYTFIVERVGDCLSESPPEAVQLPDALAFRGASPKALAVAVATITGAPEVEADAPPALEDGGLRLGSTGSMGHAPAPAPIAAAVDSAESFMRLERPESPVPVGAVRDVLSTAGLKSRPGHGTRVR